MKRILLFLFFSQICVGQTDTISTKTIDIEEVIVTATRSSKNLKNVPIPVQVITSNEIKKSQATDFKHFLETEFSSINFSNHGNRTPSINMMGFDGKYVLFLINGERMAGETFDNIDYNRINLDNIERIEVIKGATSSLYGSNALGGVINIITKNSVNPLEISVNYLYDTSEDHNASLLVGTNQQWGTARLSSFFKHRKSYLLTDTKPLELVYQNRIETGVISELNIAGFTNYGISPELKFNLLPKKLNVEIFPNYYFSQRNSGTESAKKVLDNYYSYSLTTKLNYIFVEDIKLSLSASYDQYDKFYYYVLLKEEEKNYENKIGRIMLQFNKNFLKKHSFVAGGELLNDELLGFRFDDSGNASTKNAKTYTLFAQQDWALSESFTLVAGLRLDYHSFFKEHFTYRLSSMYKVENFIFRGGYSTGFRSPTLKELYTNWFHPWGGGFQIMGNQNLKPEVSSTLNFSADYFYKGLNFTAMTQISELKDRITEDWNDSRDRLIYLNQNGKTRIIGSEFSVGYRYQHFNLKGSYAFFNIERRKSQNRPHTLTFKAEYIPSEGKKYIPNVILSGKWVSSAKLYDVSAITNEEYFIPYESYAIWRLNTSFKLPNHFILTAGINNLWDYVTPTTSFYTPTTMGRTFFVGLKWNFVKD